MDKLDFFNLPAKIQLFPQLCKSFYKKIIIKQNNTISKPHKNHQKHPPSKYSTIIKISPPYPTRTLIRVE